VIVAGLGTAFNMQDLKGSLQIDPELGLCPAVIPPGARCKYSSIAQWAAIRRQRNENLGEELRLLYVAFTRACQKLLLFGAAKKHDFAKWEKAPSNASIRDIAGCGRAISWLGSWLFRYTAAHPDIATWQMVSEAEIREASSTIAVASPQPETLAIDDALFAWSYPHASATRESAKTSVSRLRKVLTSKDDESATFAPLLPKRISRAKKGREEGVANHTFMELADIENCQSIDDIRQQMQGMIESGHLSEAEAQSLDLEGIATFWDSAVGREIATHAALVERELPFTVRIDPGEFAGVAKDCGDDFVVCQGVVDLAVLLPKEIWLVDFKTDQVRSGELTQKVENYRPQILLYALALQKIYQRPVTRKWLCFLRSRETVPIES
jgi:ATP-dependent helicase/nuclease subunit A